MTEKRKAELRHLLMETMKGLEIRYEYGSLPIPIEVYRNYLQERRTFYGVDYLSFAFSTHFTIFIVGENGELKPFYKIDRDSKLLDFIKEELAPFIRKGNIPEISTGSYIVESGFTDGSRLFCLRGGINQQHHILERLLHIVIVRGIEEAVLAFERSCCPEGLHVFFQFVALVEGIRIKTEIPIFDKVRLVPLPSLQERHITEDILRYLPGFPSRASFDEKDSFYGKTLLVIDLPGFSIFHKPPQQLFEHNTKVSDLTFQVEEYDLKIRNSIEINTFIKSFFQALSLVCNSSFEIYHTGWFLGEDKSLHGKSQTTITRSPFLERNPFKPFIEVGTDHINEAVDLYNCRTQLNPEIQEKLQIPVGRWVKSHTYQNWVDKIIDLGIALESLYLPKDNVDQLSFQFRLNASWHLGKKRVDREKLIDEFKAIYTLRSKAVHNGAVPERIKIRKGEEPIPTSEFIPKAQDLCRQSILKILEDGEFPDWNNLILGEESL